MLKRDKLKWLKLSDKFQGVDTPFLAVDIEKAKSQVKLFRDHFPECEIYYAIKSFNDQRFLKELLPLVDGFDIASSPEGQQVINIGADPKDLMFSNPVKKPEHIQDMQMLGANNYAFDSINELTKLAQTAPGANVYLRMKVYDHGSAFPLSSKFGAAPSHVVALMSMAVELGLKPKGITFHVGSQSESLHAWEVALDLCGSAMKRLQKVGIKLEFINLGGGFPVRYTERVPDFKRLVRTIRAGIEEHFPYKVQIKAEPGRFISAESGLMVTTVIGTENRAGVDWVFTDVGAFNGLIEPLEIDDWKYPIFSASKDIDGEQKQKLFTVTGPTCDSSDTYAFRVPLPADIAVGDRLYIGCAGAYSVVYASNFNGFGIPKVHYIDT